MTKRILWIAPPIALRANVSGAASRYLQNLRMLDQMGFQVTGVRVGNALDFEALGRDAGDNDALVQCWHEVRISSLSKRNKLMMLLQSLYNPVSCEYPQADRVGAALANIIREALPDLIWAEGIDLAAAMYRLSSRRPWLYSQTDIAYRVRRIRAGTKPSLGTRWQLRTAQRAEKIILKAAPCILTGASSDAHKMRQLGGKQVTVIPIAYDPIPLSGTAFAQTPHIVHLGSLETTANRVGLTGYLQKVHPRVRAGCSLELYIIGDASRVKPPLSDLLLESGAVLVGYQPDLSSVLRPGDLAILPYEHDTGYRTKLPLLLAYGQVVISTRAALAGSMLPGLEESCLIVDRAEDFPAVILRLARDQTERKRLSEAGRAFFEAHFTHQSVLDLYREFMKGLS